LENPLLEKVEQNRFWKKRAKSLLEKAMGVSSPRVDLTLCFAERFFHEVSVIPSGWKGGF
jgi:hypothetical protein